jgi:hypothetical protein
MTVEEPTDTAALHAALVDSLVEREMISSPAVAARVHNSAAAATASST